MDANDRRLYLQARLEEVFDDVQVYYQPPGNIILNRPCIIYETKSSDPSYANNMPYVIGTTFQVTLLSDLPGYQNKDRMFEIPVVLNNRAYISSDIVHDIFTISINRI